MKNTVKSLLLTAALSGMLSGAALAQQHGTPAEKKDQPKAEKNSCKVKAGCGAKTDKKDAKQDAKDKNSCSANKGHEKDKNSCSANKGNGGQKPPSA